MKFKIKGQEISSQVVELELYSNSKGKIGLKCQNSEGTAWVVMEFREGLFYRVSGIPDNIGLKVDKTGRILEAD